MPSPFEFRLRVRYGECDAQGVVFNARYGDYVDIAVNEYIRTLFGDYQRLLEMGYDVYQAYPRANEEQLYKVLQDSYHRHQPALAVPWDEARWLVRHAWHHAQLH